MINKLLLIFVACIFQLYLLGQANIRLKHISISNGLSNNNVRAIFQDSKGYMWFGTDDGLDRYDAYGFRVFRNRVNDSTSLPHNYISAINEDKKGNILVGTGQGAVSYSDAGGLQPLFYLPYKSGNQKKISESIFGIETSNDGSIFLGSTVAGLITINPKGNARQIPFLNGNSTTTHYNLQALTIDKQQQVWLFLRDLGLAKYDRHSDKVILVNSPLKSSSVNRMIADDNGNLWIGSATGLYKYSIPQNKIVNTFNASSNQLSADYVSALVFDKENNLWIATQEGVDILNLQSETFK